MTIMTIMTIMTMMMTMMTMMQPALPPPIKQTDAKPRLPFLLSGHAGFKGLPVSAELSGINYCTHVITPRSV